MADPTIRAGDIAKAVGGRLIGDADAPVAGVCILDKPQAGRLCFARDRVTLRESGDPTLRGAVLLAPPGSADLASGTRILVDDPQFAFALALHLFFAPKERPGVAASAHVDPSAAIGEGVMVGEGCVIGSGVVIGDGSEIRHMVVLGAGVKVGARCLIGSHSVIGEVGFGWAKDKDGRRQRMPHVGSVHIGDDVEIGALTSIASGTLAPTRIGDRVKIDDHVFIAHNCDIGDNVIIIAGAEISGSVRIGRDSWIGPMVSIRDGLHIADNVLVGIGSTVVKSIDEAGIYAGSPARYLKPNIPENAPDRRRTDDD
jgi:UDP-3-O-[3-hydroxymyristoyl] glucosamine N-acyltransferase LpxD